MFMKLREDILSLAGEFSENIGSKLDEINSLARRAGEMDSVRPRICMRRRMPSSCPE